MSFLLTSRQADALREVTHMGSAQAASMLARLVGDVGVLVDVPVIVSAPLIQLGWLLGGRDVKVHAATFEIEGDLPGQLWWVLKDEDAKRLGKRLLSRPGISGPLSTSATAALAEAANIVASACLSTLGTLTHTSLRPSTPHVALTSVGQLVDQRPADVAVTLMVAQFLSTNTPPFGGWLVLMMSESVTSAALSRLGM